MCGIAGLASPTDQGREDLCRTVERMTRTLNHRGPDAEGFFIAPRVALGHRRLKIIDLVTGEQPMVSQSGRFVISYNGEIYNFRELRRALEKGGVTFRTASDTEVLLELFVRKGLGALDACLGMFALAIWDQTERRLTLVRDRLGKKPLWYAVLPDGTLLFGSEVKAVLSVRSIKASLDRGSVLDYLLYRQPGRVTSLFEGIQQVPPGTALEWQDGRVTFTRYWDLDPHIRGPRLPLPEIVALVRDGVRAAVRRRLIADVPVGAYLSGGLDSSIVVAVMSQESTDPVKTFSVGFPEQGFNEFEYARLVAERYATDHHEINLDLADYRDCWRAMIRFRDSPLSVPNEVALYRMSLELRKHITVVLSGEGADELFGGYGRLFRSGDDFDRLQALGRHPELFSPSAAEELAKPLRSRYGRREFATGLEFFLARYQWFGADLARAFMNGSAAAESRLTAELQRGFDRTEGLDTPTRFLYLFQLWHLHGLLMRLDVTTMAAAVEARVPFVDHTLIETVFSQPFDAKCRYKSDAHAIAGMFQDADYVSEKFDTTKWALRQAFAADLPQPVLNRPKVGFPVPLGPWLGRGLAEFAREVLSDSTVRDQGLFNAAAVDQFVAGSRTQEDGLKVWMLCNVGLFLQEYFA